MNNELNLIQKIIKSWCNKGKTMFYTIDVISSIKGKYLRDKYTSANSSYNARIGRLLSKHCFDKYNGTYNKRSGKWPLGRAKPTLPIILHKINCPVKDIEGKPSHSALWLIVNVNKILYTKGALGYLD